MHWVVLAMLTIAAWSAVGLLQKLSSTLLDPAALVFWVAIGLFVGSVPLVAWLPSISRPELTGGGILLGLSCGVTNALGNWCLFRALKHGGPAAIAIPLSALYPLLTVLLAVLVLGETLTFQQTLGALLAIGGGALLSFESAPSELG